MALISYQSVKRQIVCTQLKRLFLLHDYDFCWVTHLQLCPCCVEASSVSRGDSATFDWWAELWMVTPGTCCQDDGMRICWVPVGQACWEKKKGISHFSILSGIWFYWINRNHFSSGLGQTNWAMPRNEENRWLISSTGKSTKPDKRATFPKPFPYYSIALQQMHKMISCKARINEAL